jgi:hypothetical protein
VWKETFVEKSNSASSPFDVKTERRGGHWIAWLTRPNDPKPVLSVNIVGENEEEARTRATEWARDAAAQGYL